MAKIYPGDRDLFYTVMKYGNAGVTTHNDGNTAKGFKSQFNDHSQAKLEKESVK